MRKAQLAMPGGVQIEPDVVLVYGLAATLVCEDQRPDKIAGENGGTTPRDRTEDLQSHNLAL